MQRHPHPARDRAADVRRGDALIVVDVQRDFLPGGALAVPEGDAVIAPLNDCARKLESLHLPIFFTRDWHPVNHCSFVENGGPWPPHCVAGTAGAEWPATLAMPRGAHVVSKATEPNAEAYSGFEGTDLAERLRALGCRRVFIGGLATDYCVRATALDALREGFEVVVLEDAVRAVDVTPGDGERALAELAAHGAHLAKTRAMTEVATEVTTEATEVAAEATTEAPTEVTTEATTEATTEVTTGAATEATPEARK